MHGLVPPLDTDLPMRRGTNKRWSRDRLCCVRGRCSSSPEPPPPPLAEPLPELLPPRRARAADGLGRQPSRRTRGCSRMLVVRLLLRRDEEERILSTRRRGTSGSWSSCRSSGRGCPSSPSPTNPRRLGSRGEGSPEQKSDDDDDDNDGAFFLRGSRFFSALSSWWKGGGEGGGGNGDSGSGFSLRPAFFCDIILREPTDENPPCRTACCRLCDD
mmetsp:Transcript_14453/g.30024  ORF Transcript_14453/g.30024 Transcript_14453/m.30024 type:complete len:215 (+) Transcript_14453:245-889(+)